MAYLCGVLNYTEKDEAISLTDKWLNRSRTEKTFEKFYEDKYLIMRALIRKDEIIQCLGYAETRPDQSTDNCHYVAFLSGESYPSNALQQDSDEKFYSIFRKHNTDALRSWTLNYPSAVNYVAITAGSNLPDALGQEIEDLYTSSLSGSRCPRVAPLRRSRNGAIRLPTNTPRTGQSGKVKIEERGPIPHAAK